MRDDPIVEEVHCIRQKLLEKYGGNLEQLMDHLKSRELNDQDRVVSKDNLDKRVVTPLAAG